MLLPNRDAKKHKVQSAMISVGVHLFLLGIFVMAYGVDKVRAEVPRFIKLKLGSSFGTGGLTFAGENKPDKNYPQELAIDSKEGDDLADFIDENVVVTQQSKPELAKKIEVKKLAGADFSSPEKVEKKVEEIQQQQPARKKKGEVGAISELETASGNAQAGSPFGNSKDGKTSLSYLELLQYTLQENSIIPHQARDEGLQGDAVLRLTFDRKGFVQEYELVAATGFEILDNAALALAQKLMQKPLPPMPRSFERGKDRATYDFPISFRPE